MAFDLRADYDRRAFLKNVGIGAAGGLWLSPLAQPHLSADAPVQAPARPKRFVFFLQNQGLHPVHCRPTSLRIRDGGYGGSIPGLVYDTNAEAIDRVMDVPLVANELPESLAALAPFTRKVTIVQSLNGKHVRTGHGAGYAALGGAQFSTPNVPSVETIDCALARLLPAPFPLLSFGWQGLSAMQSSPISYCSSAWGTNLPAPGYSNPLMAHRDLFGAGGTGQALAEFQNDTELLGHVSEDIRTMQRRLSGSERALFQPLVSGYESMSQRREQLAGMAETLRRHAPPITEKFTAPRVETDWREANFEVACGALIAKLTNVVSIACGMCHVDRGPFDGLQMTKIGHDFGHSPPQNPDWIKVHSYSMRMLATLIRRLEAVPEGAGTMMDNTLIVYTSCHAESQHSSGDRWPFVLIGDLGGRLRTGRYIHYPIAPRPLSRSYNALYATLLHAAGFPRDHFNLIGAIRGVDRQGPLPELLA